MALHHATAKKYARNLIKAAMIAAEEQRKLNLAALRHRADDRDEEDDADEEESKMSTTIAKYRKKYVATTNYAGNASCDNNDAVAAVLRGLSPDETCAVADHLFGEMAGTHWEKYRHLNAGSRRMNAGNRIRGAIRRGAKTLDELEAAVKGDDLTDDSDETVVVSDN